MSESGELQVCIVGAGSSYTPELVEGLLARASEELPVAELRLHDLDEHRLTIMAGLATRMAQAAQRPLRMVSGTQLEPLLEGVDFVVTQIRVGGMAARYLDESIPLRYGIIGQETTGPGGLFKALRTIPPMLDIARAVERVAPQAFILNYTNPSGIIAEAVRRHTGARLIGLCSGIPGLQDTLQNLLRDEFGEIRSYCVGLNHLGFIHRVLVGERNITDAALERVLTAARAAKDHAGFGDPEFIRVLRAIPLGYLHYYLARQQAVAHAREAAETRAQQIMRIEEEIFREAQSPTCTGKPQALSRRGGGGYSNITFRFMAAIAHDTGAELVCTVPNDGAVEGIELGAGVEVVCRVGKHGPAPLPVGPIPLAFRGLVQAVKAYETLTVAAAVERRRDLVVQALVNHPLAGDLSVIEPLVDELLRAHALDYH